MKLVANNYSNIKIVFFPPNTTSVLQPLDLGVIKAFKSHYRKLLMSHIVAKIDSAQSVKDIVNSLTIIPAVRWIAEAWKMVCPLTIRKCFRNSGMLAKDFSTISRDVTAESEDPFAGLEEGIVIPTELQGLMSEIQGDDGGLSADQFVSMDDNVPTCSDFTSEHWEEEFLNNIDASGSRNEEICARTGDGDSEDEEDRDILAPRLKSLKQAMSSLEDVCSYLDYNGYLDEASDCHRVLSRVQSLHLVARKRQSTLEDYFYTCDT